MPDRRRSRRALVNLLIALAAVTPLVAASVVTWRAGVTYTGVGDVVSVDAAALELTINHDDIPGLMPAMTMVFPVRDSSVITTAEPGTRVRFELFKKGNTLRITRVTALGAATGGRPGFHDHTPHHGGVVLMWGMLHFEVAASREGWVRVYVSDVWRRPLPPQGWSGSVTLDLPEGARTLVLQPGDGALVGGGPPLLLPTVLAHVRVAQSGEPIEMHVLLPLSSDSTGAALSALPRCVAPPLPAPDTGRLPRCAVAFGLPVTVVSTTPDAATAVVAVVSVGITAWRVADGELLHGFAPAPPTQVSPEHPPHGEAANAIAMSPDGREMVAALDRRLLRYAVSSGRLLRELSSAGGMVRHVAWSPDGAALLVSRYGDTAAHLVRADDGGDVRRLPIEDQPAGVAFSADGRVAAVGSEGGPIFLFDPTTDAPPRVLREPQTPTDVLSFVDAHLVAAGGDGVARMWSAATGALVTQFRVAGPSLALAAAPPLLAVAGRDRVLRLYDLRSGALVETLGFHRAGIYSLRWAGATLVSGDNEGLLALWDLSDRLATPLTP